MPALQEERTIQAALGEPGVWPNMSQAAGIVGLTKSTLSKHAGAGHIDYEVLGLGRGYYVLPPREVLRIGSRYHRLPADALVDRLTKFLQPRLGAESDLLRRVLSRILDDIDEGALSGSRETPERVDPRESGRAIPRTERNSAPMWLLEVERLRDDPAGLTGRFSFVSPDDTVGHIRLGAPVDDVAGVTSANWQVR